MIVTIDSVIQNPTNNIARWFSMSRTSCSLSGVQLIVVKCARANLNYENRVREWDQCAATTIM